MSTPQLASPFAPPFEIGAVYWLPNHYPTQVRVECPVCAGQLAIVVILGDGEHVGVPCGGCGIGFDGPRGFIDEWTHALGVARFEIASVDSMHGGEWHVRSTTGAWANFNDLQTTEHGAMAESERRCAANEESNMRSRQRKRRNVAEKAGWTVRYHRECIKDLERQLSWHQAKVASRRPGVPASRRPGAEGAQTE